MDSHALLSDLILDDNELLNHWRSIENWYAIDTEPVDLSSYAHEFVVINYSEFIQSTLVDFFSQYNINVILEQSHHNIARKYSEKYFLFSFLQNDVEPQTLQQINSQFTGSNKFSSFLFTRSLPELKFYLSKLVYKKISLSKTIGIDALFDRTYGFEPHADGDFSSLRNHEFNIIGLKAHGEASHLILNKTIICGHTLSNEVMLDDLSQVNNGCNRNKCKRINSDSFKSISIIDIKAEMFLAFTCHGFYPAKNLYPSSNSSLYAAMNGYARHFISALDTHEYTPLDLPFWLSQLSGKSTVSEVVKNLNKTQQKWGRPPTFFHVGLPFEKFPVTDASFDQLDQFKLQDTSFIEVNSQSQAMSVALNGKWYLVYNKGEADEEFNIYDNTPPKDLLFSDKKLTDKHLFYRFEQLFSIFLSKDVEYRNFLAEVNENLFILDKIVEDSLNTKIIRIDHVTYYLSKIESLYDKINKLTTLHLAKRKGSFDFFETANAICRNNFKSDQNICSCCSQKSLLRSSRDKSIFYQECLVCGPLMVSNSMEFGFSIDSTIPDREKNRLSVSISATNTNREPAFIYIFFLDKTRGKIAANKILQVDHKGTDSITTTLNLPENLGSDMHTLKVFLIQFPYVCLKRQRLYV